MSHDTFNETTARDTDPAGQGDDKGLGGMAAEAGQGPLTSAQYLAQVTHLRQPCEIWTRVMGYHRPTRTFNPGKKAEHAERKLFIEHPV